MSVDRVFATAKPEEVFVFRHNFAENKWENVASRKDGSATVTFRKRGSAFFIRIVPDGGEKEEHQLSPGAPVKDSGDGFIQVPLPTAKQLIGIKYKRVEMAAFFLGKIREDMSVQGPVMMQAVVLDEKPATGLPNPEQLPAAIGYGAGPTTLPPFPRKPATPPSQAHHGNVIEATDNPLPGLRPPAELPPQGAPRRHDHPLASFPAGQPVPYRTDQPPVGQFVNVGHPLNAPPPGSNPGQQSVGPGPFVVSPTQQQYNPQSQLQTYTAGPQVISPELQPYNPGQPVNNPGQPVHNPGQPVHNVGQQPYNPVQNVGQVKASREMMEVVAPPVPQRKEVRPAAPKPPEPEVPSFSSEDPSDHASFLANAINTGNFEAAHKMIHVLQKMVEMKKPQRKVAISYSPSSSNGPSVEDDDVKLHLSIEFQSPHKTALQLFLDFKSSLRISDIQQHLELSHHIPKATQNWIIGEHLVKGDQLSKTLRDFGIVGEGTTAKVFVYVMHSKKAHVPKEEFEAIRQCQQEEWERKRQGLRQPWQEPPPSVPPRSHPQPHSQYPPPQGRWMDPAGPGFMPRPPGNLVQPPAQGYHVPQPRGAPPTARPAWGPHPTVGDDTYARVNHNIPAPTVAPPPERVQVNFDPAYEPLQNYQQHPAEGRPHPPAPQATPPPVAVGYSRPPANEQFPGGYPTPAPHLPPQPHPHQPLPPQPRPPQPRPPQPAVGYPPEHRGPPPQQLPPPMEPRPPPPAPVGWSCPQCTFINKPRRPGCEICSADRPADYQIPDYVPMDADEVRIVAGLQGSDFMYNQFTAAEKQKRERERAQNFQALLQAEEEALITNEEEFDCPICLDTMEPGEGVTLRNCLHQFCKECLKETIMNSPDAEVKCPFKDHDYECNAALPEREIKQLVSEQELQDLYKRGLRQAESAAANSYHCKTTDCEGFCFYEDEVNHYHCPLCKKVNCLTCKAIHDDMNCQEYQEDLKRRAANDEAAKATQEMLEGMVEAGDAMHCPSCKIVVQKKDGCDWIRCSVCKTEICWATKQARWGPKGKGDKSGGCHCRENGRKCHPLCRNCH